MKIYVVYGTDQTEFYPSGYAEVHYAGSVKEEAHKAAENAMDTNGEDWKVNVEVWEDGKKIETLFSEI